MKAFRFFSLALLLSLTTACATKKPKYHLDFAAMGETYNERYPGSLSAALTSYEGANVTTLEGDDRGVEMSGGGFRIGITEEISEIIVTRIAYTYADLGEAKYRFNIQGEGDYQQTFALVNSGLEVSIGINLWILRPALVIKKLSSKVESNQSGVRNEVSSSSASASYMGYGISTEFDLGKKSKIYLEYSSVESQEIMLNDAKITIDMLC